MSGLDLRDLLMLWEPNIAEQFGYCFEEWQAYRAAHDGDIPPLRDPLPFGAS